MRVRVLVVRCNLQEVDEDEAVVVAVCVCAKSTDGRARREKKAARRLPPLARAPPSRPEEEAADAAAPPSRQKRRRSGVLRGCLPSTPDHHSESSAPTTVAEEKGGRTEHQSADEEGLRAELLLRARPTHTQRLPAPPLRARPLVRRPGDRSAAAAFRVVVAGRTTKERARRLLVERESRGSRPPLHFLSPVCGPFSSSKRRARAAPTSHVCAPQRLATPRLPTPRIWSTD